jgi:RNA polymerase sigma-70 factor (ECF subfamily)
VYADLYRKTDEEKDRTMTMPRKQMEAEVIRLFDGTTSASSSVARLFGPAYSDREIVSRMSAGDRAAGAALVERFLPVVNRRVRHLIGTDTEHLDIVQQVFAQIVSGLPQLNDGQALADWVGKVTVNVVRNELRRRKVRSVIRFFDEPEELLVEDCPPEVRLGLMRCIDILKKMPVDERIAFVLRFVEELELKEIAAMTDCSLATVKRRVFRGREMFLKKASREPALAHLLSEEELL